LGIKRSFLSFVAAQARSPAVKIWQALGKDCLAAPAGLGHVQGMELFLKKELSAQSIEEAFAGMPVFANLSPELLRILSKAAMRTRFSAGQKIFQQGEPANRFYIIEQGKVSLIDEADGEPCRFGIVEAHEILGWSWLFPPHTWRFTARAVTAVQAIFFYATPLREACEADHDFGYELMKRFSAVMVQRLQSSREELIEARRRIYHLSTAATPVEQPPFSRTFL
jgi:CRP-like cAMP-binding protein